MAILLRQAAHPLEHPLGVARGRQRVDVEHRLPGRLVLLELGQGGPAVDAARVLVVAPEVVEIVAPLGDTGNPRLRIERRQRLPLKAGELGMRLEPLGGGGVLLLDPGHGALAVDLLEPEVGVFCGGHLGRPAAAPGGEAQKQQRDGCGPGMHTTHHRPPFASAR